MIFKFQEMNELVNEIWYENLIQDIKLLEFSGIVATKHAIGKRILEDFEKFGKPEYGEKRVENIAKDVGCGKREIERCIQFANDFELDDPRLRPGGTQLSWHEIHDNLLPEHKEKPKIPEFPDKKYGIIYTDPAWKYYEGGYKNQEQHYDTLETQYIIDFIDENQKHVKELAAENCILFIWTTSPMLPKMPELLESWEFKYSTVGFVWVKSKKDGTGFFFGNGVWTRANTEYCLIARKGKIERQDAAIPQIVYEPKKEHSKKPDCVRDKIIKLVGDLPRIELFARKSVNGWDNWGNEM